MGVQNKPDNLIFTRPYNRIRFNPTKKWIIYYIKTNMDAKSNFKLPDDPMSTSILDSIKLKQNERT